MKVKMRRVRKPKIPKLRIDRKTWAAIGHVAIGDMLDRIDKQRQPNGRRIKRNAPSTIERKRREGKRLLSLRDTGKRFHSASGYRVKHLPRGVGIVVAPKDQTVAGYVIEKGYYWIGLSKEGWAAVRSMIRAALRKRIKQARR